MFFDATDRLSLFVNEDGKFCSPAEYYYNSFVELWCVVGTTYAFESLDDLLDSWESSYLLSEIEIPSYITGPYFDGAVW